MLKGVKLVKTKRSTWLNCKSVHLKNNDTDMAQVWYTTNSKDDNLIITTDIDMVYEWLRAGRLVHSKDHDVGVFIRNGVGHYTVKKELLKQGKHYGLTPYLVDKFSHGKYHELVSIFATIMVPNIFVIRKLQSLSLSGAYVQQASLLNPPPYGTDYEGNHYLNFDWLMKRGESFKPMTKDYLNKWVNPSNSKNDKVDKGQCKEDLLRFKEEHISDIHIKESQIRKPYRQVIKIKE